MVIFYLKHGCYASVHYRCASAASALLMDVEQIKAHSETRCGVSREEWYAAMRNIGEKERMQMNVHTPWFTLLDPSFT